LGTTTQSDASEENGRMVGNIGKRREIHERRVGLQLLLL
jgi:hypothetical protein